MKQPRSKFVNALNEELNIKKNAVNKKLQEKINNLEKSIRSFNELIGYDNPYEYEEHFVNRTI